MIRQEDIDLIIAERYRLSKINDDEWAYPIQLCQAQLTELLSRDIAETIRFLNEDCTEEEYAWISEVFDDVAKETKSKDFVRTLYKVAKKYPRETKENHIMIFIEDARKEVGLDKAEVEN